MRDLRNTDVESLTATYESNLQSARRLERDDRRLRSAWQADLQVQRVRVTARSRGAADRLSERSFQTNDRNEKWSQCLFVHRRQVRQCMQQYLSHESECLLASAAEDERRAAGLLQLEKEIRKWRKGYRYLVNTCRAENPADEGGAQKCLVEYMEKDHYNQVIERLLVLKLEGMGRLYAQTRAGLVSLQACLRGQLTDYERAVSSTADALRNCYNATVTLHERSETPF